MAVDTAEVALSDELREARERLGLNQIEVAELLDTTEETVSNWERGVTKRPRGLARIRRILQLDTVPDGAAPVTQHLDDGELWARYRELGAEVERRYFLHRASAARRDREPPFSLGSTPPHVLRSDTPSVSEMDTGG